MKRILTVLAMGLFAAACGGEVVTEALGNAEVEELGAVGAKADGELRKVHLVLEPGQIKRYRVKAVGFVARLEQRDGAEVLARLSAKHYEIDIYGEAAAAAAVTAEADDTVRNWTLRVENLGDDTLDTDVVVAPLPADEPDPPAPSLGILSDIDKTVLPKHDIDDNHDLPDAFPGVAALYHALEAKTFYVTARNPERIEGLDAWMAEQGLPEGPIEPGQDNFFLAQQEKIDDISAIFEANPDTRFVMFGDTSHRDPEVYRAISELFPEQVAAVVMHKVNNVNPNRVEGFHVHTGYAAVAAMLFGDGLLDEETALSVMATAQEEGEPISDDEIVDLIDVHRP